MFKLIYFIPLRIFSAILLEKKNKKKRKKKPSKLSRFCQLLRFDALKKTKTK